MRNVAVTAVDYLLTQNRVPYQELAVLCQLSV